MSADAASSPARRRCRFGLYEVDPAGALYRQGKRVPVQEKPLQLLAALLEKPGELVTREELRERLWPEGAFVEFDDGLNTAVLKLRQALGDSARSPRFIETVPRRGYRFLVRVDSSPGSAEPSATRQAVISSATALVSGMALAALVLVVSFAPRLRRPHLPRVVSTGPVTAVPGLEHAPDFTPDGTRVVYASDQLGQMDIWVRQTDGGLPVVLTPDFAGFDGHPRVSPDGRRIAFASLREGGGLFVMTSLGGGARRVAAFDFVPSIQLSGSSPTVDWSPSGSEIVYAVGIQNLSGLFLVGVETGSSTRIELPAAVEGFSFSEPSWSPDGERIAFVAASGAAATVSRVWQIGRDGSSARALTSGRHRDRSPIWHPDGKGLFFTSDRGGTPDAWWLPIDRQGRPGSAVAVTTGAGAGTIGVSPDARQLVYTKLSERSNLWRAPVPPSGPIELSSVEPFSPLNQLVESVVSSRDGQWLAFDSNRTGNMDVWRARPDGTGLQQITHHPEHDWTPSFSPLADRVAFHSLRDGNREIYVASVSGGPARRLTYHPAKDWVACWSPAGEEIAFTSQRHGNPDVFLIASDGSGERPLTRSPANDHNPLWTPDGEALVFTSDRDGSSTLYIVDRQGGEPRRRTDEGWMDLIAFDWSADGSALYAWGRRAGTSEPGLWTLRDGEAEPLLLVGGFARELLAGASDGARLYFPLWETTGDLWLAQLEWVR